MATLNIDKDILSKISLLYAEDDDEIREQMSLLLSKFIPNIECAIDGKEALQKYQNSKDGFDIILTDIQMPRLDGLEFSKGVKEINSEIPIVVTTAFNDSSYLLKSIDIGVDAYIIKPLDPKKVLEAINKLGKIVLDRKELQKYREDLEARVKEEVEKSKKKDEILQKQSLQASMGEMINSIAHQWRQPLNAINVESTNIIVGLDLEEDKDVIKSYSNNIIRLTKKMSKIITEFMDFNNPNKGIIEFSLKELVYTTKDVLKPQLSKSSINLDIDIKEDITLTSSISALKEALVNIINNSKDALVENNSQRDRNIKIYTQNSKDSVSIFIEDNAGGIPKEYFEQIFDPYFTTKPKGIGTGIGLSIVKKLVEKQLYGEIEYKNINNGVLFKITLPTKGQ
jgi:signal transduction histidine kinase